MSQPFSISQALKSFPLVLADVGSKGGLNQRWKPASPYLKTIGFEPDQRSFSKLPQTDREIHLPIGLHESKGQLTINLTTKAGVSSNLTPNYPFLKKFPIIDEFTIDRTTPIPIDTLDHVLTTRNLPSPDFIKIDTQGTELPILKGATKSMNQSLLGIELEVVFSPLYKDQPLFSSLDDYIRPFGFTLFDLSPYYFKRSLALNAGFHKGQLIQADALYLRSISSFNSLLNDIIPEKQLLLISKFITICIIYGYFDYAYEIVEAAAARLSPDQTNDLHNHLHKQSRNFSNQLPDFPTRGYLAYLLRLAGNYLRPVNPRGRLNTTLGNFPSS